MTRWLAAAAALLAGCFSVPPVKPGTLVAHDALREHRDDLRAYAAERLAAERSHEAFYIAEVYKTRGYVSRRLAAMPYPGKTGHAVHADLRPVFRQVVGAAAAASAHASRGLVLTDAGTSALEAYATRTDELFWDDMELVGPRYSSGVFSYGFRNAYPIASIEQARLVFPRGSAFASFLVVGDDIVLFWLRDGVLAAHAIPGRAPALRAQAAQLLSTLRTPPAERPRGADWRGLAHGLFEGLFSPVLDQVRSGGIESLYVSPDGFIANVPFDLLLVGDELLMERIQVSIAPSASIHRMLLMTVASRRIAPRVLAVGNPVYPEGVLDLPFAEKEARLVSEIFDETALLAGAAATEAAVREAIPKFNVLHFATHAVLLGRAAPDASSLLLTQAGADDGFLSAAEVAAIDLGHVALVVLSACETSVSDARGASLDLGSLTGAFLGAGVPAVIGTLWQVHDESTTRLMIELYRLYVEVGPGEALRQAKLAMWRGAAAHRDPYYWGAFVLYGWGQ